MSWNGHKFPDELLVKTSDLLGAFVVETLVNATGALDALVVDTLVNAPVGFDTLVNSWPLGVVFVLDVEPGRAEVRAETVFTAGGRAV